MIKTLIAGIIGIVGYHFNYAGFEVHQHTVTYRHCNEGTGCSIKKLPVLNSDQLHVYSSTGYARDNHTVYYQTDRLNGADAADFSVVDHCWGKDHRHVYQYHRQVAGADPSTFRPLASDMDLGCAYGADRNHVIVGNTSHPACDARTLHAIENTVGWIADNQCIYYDGVRVKGADVATFQPLIDSQNEFTGFAKDKHHVYFLGKILHDADAASFHVKSAACMQDKNHYYDDNGSIMDASRC